MVTEGFEQYLKLGKTFLNPWGDIGKTYMEIYRRANQEALTIAGENLNRTADQLKRFSDVKRPDELFNLQKEYLNENISAIMGDVQKLINISLGSIEEINKAFTTTLKEPQQQGSYSSAPTGEGLGKKRT